MWMLLAPVRRFFLLQGSKLGPQGKAKGLKMENVWWAKNINDFYVNFARACQDHTFVARMQMGTPRNHQRNENGKCLMGEKQKRLSCEFCAHLSGSHICRKDQSWDPKKQPKEWKCKPSDGQKNTNDFHLNCVNDLQDHDSIARIQNGTHQMAINAQKE